MASRAIWKGQLRLSLVSIPVEIHSATKRSSRISFRQIHEPSGKRVKYEKTVPGIGPVDKDDIVKGYDTGDDQYMLIDPEELDAIKLDTKKTFELVQFVEACEIPPLYFDKPYYIVPTDELAQDAYRVVRDALRSAGKVGLGQFTMRGKEYLGAVKPCGDGLLLETLHYADELRDLIAAKRKNKKTKRVSTGSDEAPSDENVVDLMAALKESLKSTKASGKTSGKGGRKKAS